MVRGVIIIVAGALLLSQLSFPYLSSKAQADTTNAACSQTYTGVRLTEYTPGTGGSINGGTGTAAGVSASTIYEYINGTQSYVAVAGDPTVESECKEVAIDIPLLDQKFNNGNEINFRMVDTGGAFKGAGFTHFDIALAGSNESNEVSNMTSTWNQLGSQVNSTTVIFQGSATAASLNTTQTGPANLATQGTGTAPSSANAVACSLVSLLLQAKNLEVGNLVVDMVGCAFESTITGILIPLTNILNTSGNLSYDYSNFYTFKQYFA